MSKPLKVGILGAGGITNSHLPAYLEHPDRVQLTAVCDLIEERAQALAEKAGVETVYTDLDRMLREGDIDAVDNCTFHPAHAPLTIACAQAGKHVIVEKPMATNLQECRDMVAAADKAGVTLMIAQDLRYSPEAFAVKRFIDEGRLGDIFAVRTNLLSPRVPPRIERARQDRYADRRQGGGTLMSVQVHHIDLLRFYVGNVKRLTAICRSVSPRMVNDAEDLVAAILEFENGALGHLFAGPGETPEDASDGRPVTASTRSYMLYGTEGTIHSTPETLPEHHHFGRIMFAPTEKRPIDRSIPADAERWIHPAFEPIDTSGVDLPTVRPFVNEILHFEECIRTGREPISSGRDNIETMKIIYGIWESSRTGKAVELDDLQ